MKILKNLLLLTLTLPLFFQSCSSDSSGGNNGNKELADQQNATEERKIPLSEIESGVSIDGATTLTGTPPAPTNNLDFQINTQTQEAFQKSGFRISFNSTDAISGAYLLLQDVDGNKSGSYYQIPSSALTSKQTKTKKHSKHAKTSNENSLTDDAFEIEVDFDTTIEPGQFCYEICLFDANGNISSIQKICVEVEAWGGNSDIVGQWVFDRYGGDAVEDDNNSTTLDCTNGGSVTANDYEDEFYWEVVLNQDGTYYELYNGTESYLDYNETRDTCSAVYEDEDYDEKYSGNWAYNEDKQTLTVIDFKYEDFLDASNNEEYPDGNVYFSSIETTARVVSGELVITETYTEGLETYTDIYFFKRK